MFYSKVIGNRIGYLSIMLSIDVWALCNSFDLLMTVIQVIKLFLVQVVIRRSCTFITVLTFSQWWQVCLLLLMHRGFLLEERGVDRSLKLQKFVLNEVVKKVLVELTMALLFSSDWVLVVTVVILESLHNWVPNDLKSRWRSTLNIGLLLWSTLLLV